MRIDRVIARAFGPFAGESLDLAPGMTVVAGPNEAGKSTWHAALRLAVTGLRRGKGPGTAADRQLAERHKPWDQPERWEVEARLTLDDGRTIDISQDLAGKVACRAVDVALGRDVSDEILDGTPDASRWLGLNREAFAATLSVSQAQIMAVAEAADQLQEQMQRAAATRGTDATAAEAIARLEQFRRDAVGADTVAAKGPLRTAKHRLAAAETALAEARRLHDAYLERGAEVELAEVRVLDARRELAAAEAAQAAELAARAEARAARAAELSHRHPAAPPTIAARDADADEVAAALQAWASRPAMVTLEGPTASELEAALAGLPEAPAGDLRPHSTVLDAARGLDLAEEALNQHGSAPAPPAELPAGLGAARLRELARRLRTPQLPPAAGLEAQLAEARRTAGAAAPGVLRPVTAAGVAGLLLAVVILVVGQPLAAAALAVAAAGVLAWAWSASRAPGAAWARVRHLEAALAPYHEAEEAAERDGRAAAGEVQALGLPVDPGVLDDLADRATEAAQLRRQAEDWLARRTSLEERLAAARERLRAALRARGASPLDDVRASLQAYLAACEAREGIAGRAAAAGELGRQLAARRAAEESAAAAAEAVRLAEERLRGAARRVGATDDGTPDLLVAALVAWQGDRTAALRRSEAAMAEWQELQALVAGGSSVDRLRAEADERAARAAALRAALPDDAAAVSLSGPALEQEVARLRDEVAALGQGAAALTGNLAARGDALPDVAEAEEAAILARRELARVEELARAVDETLRLLRTAEEQVHRNLAPILGSAIARWLPAVCDGAYTEVSVDPADLSIRVKETATGTWRQARLLSEGTREQIYLLLRVAMAEHLVTTRERAPLLLDEVTAQADAERKARLLDVLHHLSSERQVILFSHDEEVVRWAERTLAGDRDRLVRLPASPRAADATERAAALVAEPVAAATPQPDLAPARGAPAVVTD